jgi:hypothetical protein
VTSREYLAALLRAGIAENLPVLEMDRRAARLLRIDERTARRYRNGESPIPGPVQIALKMMGEKENRA